MHPISAPTEIHQRRSSGQCIECAQPFTSENVKTEAGWHETRISGICERCFDAMFYEDDCDDILSAAEAAVDAYSLRLDDLAEASADLSNVLAAVDTPEMHYALAREDVNLIADLLVPAYRAEVARRHAEIEKQEAEQARREGVFHG